MDKEIWKDIPQFEGLYQVSNLGRVRSLPRARKGRGKGFHMVSGRILRPIRMGDYLGFQLSNIKTCKRYCHRLVAECFLEKIDGKNEINHIDGNKHNNTLSNLEWCNRSENGLHAFRTGLHKPHVPTNRKKILVVYPSGDKKVFSCIKEASDELNVSASSISRACSQGKNLECKCKVYYYTNED
jgi:hypothetical protein